jgi:hypothetical protein
MHNPVHLPEPEMADVLSFNCQLPHTIFFWLCLSDLGANNRLAPFLCFFKEGTDQIVQNKVSTLSLKCKILLQTCLLYHAY